MYANIDNISEESKLLILGSEPNIGPDSLSRLKGVDFKSIGLESFIKNASRNYLIPLLYNNLRNYGDLIPVDILEKLKNKTFQSVTKQLRQEAEFKKISKLFSEKGIEFIVLKGFYLAHKIYLQPSLRPMVDIDIMVTEKKLNLAKKSLEGIGFKQYAVSEHQFISDFKHHPYGFRFDNVAVELHRNIFSSYDHVQFAGSLLWEKPHKFEFKGQQTLTLQPEIFLYHLCHHLMGHLHGDFIKLIWCRDVAEFIRHHNNSLDWEYFIYLSKLSDAPEELLHPLVFAVDWLNCKVPEFILEHVKSPVSDVVNDYLWFTQHEKNKKPRLHLVKKFNEIHGKQKIKYVFWRLFPVPGFLLRHYRKRNKAHLFYLYPFNFLKLILSGIKSVYHNL